MIANIPDHPPMDVSIPVLNVPAKLVKETVYMPSNVARRLLGALGGLAALQEQMKQTKPQSDNRPPRH